MANYKHSLQIEFPAHEFSLCERPRNRAETWSLKGFYGRSETLLSVLCHCPTSCREYLAGYFIGLGWQTRTALALNRRPSNQIQAEVTLPETLEGPETDLRLVSP